MRDLTTLTRGALLLSAIVLGACTDDDSDSNGTDTGSATGTSSGDAGARSGSTSGSAGSTSTGSTQTNTAGRASGGGGSGATTARAGSGAGGATSTATNQTGGSGGASNTGTSAGGTGGSSASGTTTTGGTGGTGGSSSSGTTTAGAGGTGGSTSGTSGGSGGTSSTAGTGGAANRAGAGGNSNAGGIGGGSNTAGAGGGANTAGAGGGGVSMVTLTDAQIASVSLAANTGEVDQNTVGVTRAANADVRSYARDMLTMHMAAVARETALAATATIIPADNEITRTLQTMSRDIVSMLTTADADEFDLMFMNSQVEVHTQVLALINDELLPQVDSEPLRTELMGLRSTVMTHLDQARMLVTSLGGSSSMP